MSYPSDLERAVSRAICKSYDEGDPDDVYDGTPAWEAALPQARAAIRAYEWERPRMKAEGWIALDKQLPPPRKRLACSDGISIWFDRYDPGTTVEWLGAPLTRVKTPTMWFLMPEIPT